MGHGAGPLPEGLIATLRMADCGIPSATATSLILSTGTVTHLDMAWRDNPSLWANAAFAP